MPSDIRVRIAPSPTGLLHIGTLRTALFNYLFAKNMGGKYILRIEDTDEERSTKEYEGNIITGLINMGLEHDEGPDKPGKYGPYRQSERNNIYKKYLEKLLESGHAYYCYCTKEELDREREDCMAKKLPPRYSGKCRDLSEEQIKEMQKKNPNPVIRLRVPDNTDIEFGDIIRGDQKQNTKDLTGDFVIARHIDSPLYNFTVVIDDHLMKISHVMRGEDHLSNTPKQILIYKALGFEIPIFAHFPLILNADKSKLSKRKNDVSVNDYLDKGYLKESIINFLALLGWNPGTEQEIFTMNELIKAFDINRVNKAGAIFNLERLDWINAEHLRKLPEKEFAEKCIPYLIEQGLIQKEGNEYKIVETGETTTFDTLNNLLKHEQKRVNKLSQISENIMFFFTNNLKYEEEILVGKKLEKENVINSLENALTVIEKIEDFNEENLRGELVKLIEKMEIKNGQMLWPIRAALTAQKNSPGAFEVAAVLGKEKSLTRMNNAIDFLKK